MGTHDADDATRSVVLATDGSAFEAQGLQLARQPVRLVHLVFIAVNLALLQDTPGASDHQEFAGGLLQASQGQLELRWGQVFRPMPEEHHVINAVWLPVADVRLLNIEALASEVFDIRRMNFQNLDSTVFVREYRKELSP